MASKIYQRFFISLAPTRCASHV